jgi:hypothetical protein
MFINKLFSWPEMTKMHPCSFIPHTVSIPFEFVGPSIEQCELIEVLYCFLNYCARIF